eukprot:823364-Pelagomonas_calceolata.AAC.4
MACTYDSYVMSAQVCCYASPHASWACPSSKILVTSPCACVNHAQRVYNTARACSAVPVPPHCPSCSYLRKDQRCSLYTRFAWHSLPVAIPALSYFSHHLTA